MRFLLVVVGAVLVGLIVYFSIRPSPHLGEIDWLPTVLTKWADGRGGEDVRTAVPFLLLGGVTGFLSRSGRRVIVSAVVLVALVLLVEGAQYFVPSRTASIQDVGWGALGGFVGLSLGCLLRKLGGCVKPLKTSEV